MITAMGKIQRKFVLNAAPFHSLQAGPFHVHHDFRRPVLAFNWPGLGGKADDIGYAINIKKFPFDMPDAGIISQQ